MRGDNISRRDALKLLNLSFLWGGFSRPSGVGAGFSRPSGVAGFSRPTFESAPWRVITVDGSPASGVALTRTWEDSRCHFRLENKGRQPVAIKELILFDVRHGLARETPFYGEGFQMLSQTGGTIGSPIDLGNYTDPKHYKLPEPRGARTVHGLAILGDKVLAFASCRRFNGKFNVSPLAVEVAIDGDGLTLAAGEQWELEEFLFLEGKDREALLAQVADRLQRNHRPLRFPVPPSGWCSWYCFGPNVTAKQVLDNLDVIAKEIPGLKYIQIDDGYQPAMGDWLETGKAFGGNVQDVLRQIRARGFEPAIWVAPFIAEKDSNVFRQHPDWFVKGRDGAPLRSDTVTFGGWRRGPWYALDGTHPEAQKHLTHVFQTMRHEWGCTYFKLDANFWGAILGGRFHDERATRIEAYRRGMEAVLRGAGDAFILGCNHPIWASVGLIHGSRSSNDIKRTWERIATTGRQNLYRNWQNGRLWWNDPDAVVLTGDLPDEEFTFHASVISATGGMVLSGDDLTTIAPERLAMLRKLQPPTGVAARFEDASLRGGLVDLGRERVACFFNWSDAPDTIGVRVDGPHTLRDFWTGNDRGRHPGGRLTFAIPARTARLVVCTPT
jgi:alpha-galactosidase